MSAKCRSAATNVTRQHHRTDFTFAGFKIPIFRKRRTRIGVIDRVIEIRIGAKHL